MAKHKETGGRPQTALFLSLAPLSLSLPLFAIYGYSALNDFDLGEAVVYTYLGVSIISLVVFIVAIFTSHSAIQRGDGSRRTARAAFWIAITGLSLLVVVPFVSAVVFITRIISDLSN